MIISKYLYRYINDEYPKITGIIKINNCGMIYQKYLNQIEINEELNKIWPDIIVNKKELQEKAKQKYQVYRNIKEYNHIYCLEYYNKHHEK